jgi:hypothetical protein
MYIIYTICILAPVLYFFIHIHNKEKAHISDEMDKYLNRVEEKEPFLDILIKAIKKIGLSLLIVAILMVGYLCLYGVYRSAKKLYNKSPTLKTSVQTKVDNFKNSFSMETEKQIFKELTE